jgi:hypothetical protein
MQAFSVSDDPRELELGIFRLKVVMKPCYLLGIVMFNPRMICM